MEEKDKSLFKYNGKTYKLIKQPKEGKSCKEFCSLHNFGCEKLCVKAYNELDNPNFGLIDAVFVEVDESENKETIMKDIEIDYKKLYEEEHKKYEDALGRARGHHSVASHYNNTDEIQELEHIFPELKEKESEDEKVRKSIIKLLQVGGYMSPEDKDKAFAWLKKQGHDGKKWIYEDAYLKEKEQLFQDGINEVLENLQKYGLEKQGEQKPVEGPEPTFNVGDWITDGSGITFQILKIENEYYIADDGDKVFIKLIDKHYHLWTIQDAKDGDVLAVENIIFIYKRILGSHIVSYCKLVNDIFEHYEDGRTCCEGNSSVHPATHEQCNLLFSKMKEAGYEWDTEKKELKKIEQKSVNKVKPKFTSGDYIRYRGENYEIKDIEETKDGFIYNVSIIGKPSDPEEVKTAIGFAAEQDIVKIEHHTWGEEDEKMFDTIIADIQFTQKAHTHEVDEAVYEWEINWLKSIKERLQPQPKWSEKDENTMKQVIDSLEALKFYIEGNDEFDDEQIKSNFKELDDEIKWLQDIVPQPKQELSENAATHEYIDLGLPSGTLWKLFNEEGYYTYDEAVEKFMCNLPTEEQWEELKNECEWEWKGNGYKVMGRNGKSIFLPAAGIRYGTEISNVDKCGDYWSSTYNDEYFARCMCFDEDDFGVDDYIRHYGRSVRLVK